VLVKKKRIPVAHLLLVGIWPSFIKKIIYSIRGYRFGKGVKLSFGSVLIGKDVEIGDHSSVGFFTIVRADKIEIRRYVKIGSMSAIDTGKLFIDDDARINEQVYVGGIKTPSSELRMGKRTIIMQASYINPTLPIEIGDDSGIGGHCLLFTHGSWNSELEGYPVKFAPITLGKKVWLPWRVFIMPGVSIGDNVVVGANSLINKSFGSNCMIAGNPAKVIKSDFPSPFSDNERSVVLERIFDDFDFYLQHNGFEVHNKPIEGGNIKEISRGSKKSSFVYIHGNVSFPSIHHDAVLLIDNPLLKMDNSNFKMTLTLHPNERKGNSDVGEELVSFLSRYGIRFNRLD
jgi:acetyltransferase-like isoleucine patch superfamily enzyme